MKLSAARKYALSLPGASEQPHFNYVSFRVALESASASVVNKLVLEAWQRKAPQP